MLQPLHSSIPLGCAEGRSPFAGSLRVSLSFPLPSPKTGGPRGLILSPTVCECGPRSPLCTALDQLTILVAARSKGKAVQLVLMPHTNGPRTVFDSAITVSLSFSLETEVGLPKACLPGSRRAESGRSSRAEEHRVIQSPSTRIHVPSRFHCRCRHF
jgi:hypothetical protein